MITSAQPERHAEPDGEHREGEHRGRPEEEPEVERIELHHQQPVEGEQDDLEGEHRDRHRDHREHLIGLGVAGDHLGGDVQAGADAR